MKNNRIAVLLLGIALMVGMVVAENVPAEPLVLSKDTICAASAELIQIAQTCFDMAKTLQQNDIDGKAINEGEVLQSLKDLLAKPVAPVLSTLSDDLHWLISLNLLSAAFDEWFVVKQLSSADSLSRPLFSTWLAQDFLERAQRRFVDDICSGKIKFIESLSILGANLIQKWLNLIDVQDSPEIQSRNVYILLENFSVMLTRMVSFVTVNVNDESGDRKMGMMLDFHGVIEAGKLAAAWHDVTGKMKFTKGEIELLGTFLTKWLPEEMPKMIAASPLATLKPGTQEEVYLCIKFLFLLYSKIEFLFLDAYFPEQGFAGPVANETPTE